VSLRLAYLAVMHVFGRLALLGRFGADSTQIVGIAHAAAGSGRLYAVFQGASALLLLAAASSSFQAGPGC
jgi:hypothetical protein